MCEQKTFQWIGKTDSPKLEWGVNGEGCSDGMECIKGSFSPEENSILFRKEYEIKPGAVRAIAQVCGLGLYQFYINGKKVGDAALAPLETQYRKRILFDEFDVTDMVCPGVNTFAAEVGNGRYSTPSKFWGWKAAWYGDPCLTVRLRIQYADGSEEVLGTDASWKCAYGAVTRNCFYDGEICDGRKAQPGWNRNGFDDGGWQQALAVKAPGGKLEQNTFFVIKKLRALKPAKEYKTKQGTVIYQFDENIPGWGRLELSGPAGAQVTLRYAESMKDGRLNVTSNRDALNTDTYYLSADGLQEYEPKFTLHGFSVVEVSGDLDKVTLLGFTGFQVAADLKQTGSLVCDNPEINRLHDCILRTQRAAMMSYPFDCPQRDERLGWLGDAHVTDLTCMYNFDMRPFYDKWLEDIRLDCHSETGAVSFVSPWHVHGHAIDWSSAYAIILWDQYLFYRDKSVLEKHIGPLLKYVDFLVTIGPIPPRTRYGDWVSVAEGWKRGDPDSCSALYYCYNLILAGKIVSVLGLEQERMKLDRMAEETRTAIRSRFYDSQAKSFDSNSQFCLSFALKLGLIPQEDRQAVFEKLIQDILSHEYHLTTGILGTKYIMEVLRDFGRQDVAMKLLLQKTYPGWLNLIDGKSTLSENWDGSGSQNHCMLGSVDGILYSMLAGIQIGEEIVVAPWFAEELQFVQAAVELPGGRLSVSWKKNAREVELNVDITGELTVMLLAGQTKRKVGAGSHVFVYHHASECGSCGGAV